MFKSGIKKLLRSFGFELRHYQADSSDDARMRSMLLGHGVNLIFDIGANTGQYGRHLREIGYVGRIVSFEPLPQVWEQLKVTSDKDPLWNIAPRAAIGDRDGEAEINISANSVSSSLLTMLTAHVQASPSSAYVGCVETKLCRLDSIGQSYIREDSALFIKIDTQGFESRVLDGAAELLQRATGVQLELSFVPLYEQQSLYDDLIQRLRKLDFELWALTPGFTDLHSGRLLQADATFFRKTRTNK